MTYNTCDIGECSEPAAYLGMTMVERSGDPDWPEGLQEHTLVLCVKHANELAWTLDRLEAL